jgi:Aspartyl/Asparaginyl beta-hydroxylase
MKVQLIGTFGYQPILNELANANLWNWLNLRKQAGHGEDIILRYQRVEGLNSPKHFFDTIECVDYFTQCFFPKTMDIIKYKFKDKKLGRIVFAKLKPGEEVKEHTDEGRYSENTDRYHLVVVTNPEAIMTTGNFNQHMGRGEIWWFNNHIPHSARNLGTTNRIHLIVDTIKE